MAMWTESSQRVPLGDRSCPRGWTSSHPNANVFCEHAMNQCLVADLQTLGLGAESVEDPGVQADRNQLPCLTAYWGTSNAAHGTQLLVGHLGNVREVNLRPDDRTSFVPCGSLAAR